MFIYCVHGDEEYVPSKGVMVRGLPKGAGSLLPPCVSQGSNSGLQAWQQVA